MTGCSTAAAPGQSPQSSRSKTAPGKRAHRSRTTDAQAEEKFLIMRSDRRREGKGNQSEILFSRRTNARQIPGADPARFSCARQTKQRLRNVLLTPGGQAGKRRGKTTLVVLVVVQSKCLQNVFHSASLLCSLHSLCMPIGGGEAFVVIQTSCPLATNANDIRTFSHVVCVQNVTN